jgi:predicted SAM-dependent methyltransferase
MKWQTKAKIHTAFDSLPFGHHLYYFLQTKITKSLPRKPAEKYFNTLRWHKKNIETNIGNLSKVTLFEFGAGWDLFYNIGFYCAGIEKQILVDLNRHAKVSLINHEISSFSALESADFFRKPIGVINSLDELDQLGIDYRAPCDARKTGLDDGSIDAIISTNTMEHIPLEDLATILLECHRLLRKGGIVSARVDYGDHYSYSDKSIGPWNYMKYSEKDWRQFNPDSHFQNRGRHSQYLALFEKAGFKIISQKALFEYPDQQPPGKDLLDPIFHGFNSDDLNATAGLFCLQKRSRE